MSLPVVRPGSFQAQQQRLFENLPKPLQQAIMKEVTGQGETSESEKDLHQRLENIRSRMEATNTFIEMLTEARPGKRRDSDLEKFRAEMAVQMKEWEDYAKEPVKVIGTCS